MSYEPRAVPQNWFADDWPESSRTTITVHEAENTHERTGLLDASGTPRRGRARSWRLCS